MISSFIFSVEDELSGERIDKVVTLKCELNSRSAAQRILDDGGVFVNGKAVSKNYKVRPGDKISVKIPEAKDNIRQISIYLGDQQTSAVVRGKIAKKKRQEASV